MGIPGLQSYMEKNPKIYYKVDILNTINNIPKDNRVIVVDGSACLTKFYGNCYIDKLANGQYQQSYQNAKKFILYFKSLEVNLVVFFDGTVVNKKRSSWIKRRIAQQEKLLNILDSLNANKRVNPNNIPMPTALNSVTQTAFSEYCEVRMACDQDCDEAILEYANKHNCLAILSQDSDFAMSLGNWSYWSIKDIDINTNSTYVYDKKALAEQLGLQECQLPLMAVLSGNDFIGSEMLRRWHQNLTRSRGHINRHQLFHSIAVYIKQYNDHLSPNDLEHISFNVFEDRRKSVLIEQTLSSYTGKSIIKPNSFLQSNESVWDKTIDEIHKKHELSLTIFNILKYKVFNSSSIYDDFRLTDLPLSGLFWRPLRAKLYGICFANHPDENINVEEWISAGPGSLNGPTFVKPVPHPFPGVDIFELISGRALEKNKNIGLLLICHSIDNILNVDNILSLPNYMIPSFLTVTYMMYNHVIGLKESKYFLQICLLCNLCENAASLVNKYNIIIKSKALRLASIYLRGIGIMKTLSQACGSTIDVKYFGLEKLYDGILFHYLFTGNIIQKYEEHHDLLQCIDLLQRTQDLTSNIQN